MINKNAIVVLLFILCSVSSFSQKKKTASKSKNTQKEETTKKKNKYSKNLAKADQAYEDYYFMEAQGLYLKLIDKGVESSDIYAKLGDTYFYNSEYAEALPWYEKLIELDDSSLSPEYYFRYAQCLKVEELYAESWEYMKEYYRKVGKFQEEQDWTLEDYITEIKKQSGRYEEVDNSSINSEFSDYGIAYVPSEEAIALLKKLEKEQNKKLGAPTQKKPLNAASTRNDKSKKEPQSQSVKEEDEKKDIQMYKEVVFTTARETGSKKNINNWNGKPFYKLYTATLSGDGSLSDPRKIEGDVNDSYHQSSAVITKDGKTMYFTKLKYFGEDNRDTKNQSRISNLKIYKANNVDGQWVDVEELPFPINTPESSSAHPALGENDTKFYFVSDRKNTMGNTDIYVIGRRKNGTFEKNPEKLGDKINTLGRETYPFVDSKGVLYFSSDGLPGFGGLDIFAAAKDEDGVYTAVNLGEPVNSSKDDFAYVIDKETNRGFFSSNREGGVGDDDLYTFLEIKPVEFPFELRPIIYGIVTDSVSKAPLAGVTVDVYDEVKEKIESVVTDENGKYEVEVKPLKRHTLMYRKGSYTEEKAVVESMRISEKKEVDKALFNELQIMVGDKVVNLRDGDDLFKLMKLEPIYFDYGGATIRKSSQAELDKVIEVLRKRPSIYVEVRSHTDSRGDDAFNMKLSKDRAKATVDYIVINGEISSDRVTGDGYGETRIINKCKNKVKCSDALHQENRRSEFIMTIKP